jgi:hypothetical protein
MEYSEKDLRLSTVSGFDAEYFNNLAISKTNIEAYEKTETLYERIFRKRKYSSFDSFRKAYNNRIKKKR